MKKFFILAVMASSFSAFADAVEFDCKDSNFNTIDVEFFPEDMSKSLFEELYATQSPAPIGYPDTFGEGDDACRDVSVTYVKHKKSGRQYAIYRTQDDYCDGGNTIGLVIDIKKYQDLDISYADAAVGEISDGEFYCFQN